jgi:putative colanic acid biosynthesis acetyltransferase WcaF
MKRPTQRTQPLPPGLSGTASFSPRIRLFRAVWHFAWLLLASWTPPPLHPWRRLLLRAFGAKIAPTARIYASAYVWYPPHLSMGPYSVMGPHVYCYCQDRITLESFVTVSQFSKLVTGTHDIDSPGFVLTTKPIVLKDHSWIAADAFVGPGVTVGEGAVLGARGATFSSLEPWGVYVGLPARKIRTRERGVLGCLAQKRPGGDASR